MKKKYADQFSYTNLESCFDKKVAKVKSKGIDKKSANSFKKDKENELKILEKKIQSGTFTFSPYLELLRVKRRDANPRMLSLPTIRDRIVLSTLKEILHIEFSDCVNKSLPNSYIMNSGTKLQPDA
jgi:retron-type reverse transcriptase